MRLVSIHAPWEGCDGEVVIIIAESYVSIHAPWEGCDLRLRLLLPLLCGFNSRTLGRVRRERTIRRILPSEFQFTHPGKGATSASSSLVYSIAGFQFTHPGKGATVVYVRVSHLGLFQFTHPGKGATSYSSSSYGFNYVSIHAPWEGCD